MQGKRERAPSLSDPKTQQIADKFCPFFVHAAHVRGRGAEVRPRREHPEDIFAPFGHNLNLARGAISDPSFESETVRLIDRGVAEADALNPPADN